MAENTGKRMISTAALCRRLGVCRQTVYRWVNAGHLNAERTPGNHYRFEADARPRQQAASQ